MTKNNQYEFSIEIDEYIFNRFVKDKVRFPFKTYKVYKAYFPKTTCNFILRDKKDDTNMESKIYLWDVSSRKPLKENINN